MHGLKNSIGKLIWEFNFFICKKKMNELGYGYHLVRYETIQDIWNNSANFYVILNFLTF